MTCAKRRVLCNIYAGESHVWTGENTCQFPQVKCPREPGEDYTKCKTICGQYGHAEMQALTRAKLGGADLRGAEAEVIGHYWMCKDCAKALADEGISKVTIRQKFFT